MVKTEQHKKMTAAIKHGARSIRPSIDGSNDWLDEITDTLVATTKELDEKIKNHPESKNDFMGVLEKLLHLSLRTVTLRGDVFSAQPPNGPVDKSLASADDENMNNRITALEKDMAAIKTDVAIIRSNYATKEDLHKELHAMTWKIFGFSSLLVGIVYFIVRSIH